MERLCFDTRLPREERMFDFAWSFALTDSLKIPAEDTQWRGVQLPHDWSTDYPVDEHAPSCGSGGYARTGIGWYCKDFTLETIPGGRVTLLFEGVYMNSEVYVNGVRIGGHCYGYTPFELEITPALKVGENRLLVRVDNSAQPNSRWYTGSGITRNVHLCHTQQVHAARYGLGVITQSLAESTAKIQASLRLLAPTCLDADVRVELTVLDPLGVPCASAEVYKRFCASATLLCDMDIAAPKRWDVETPVLYTLLAKVYEGGRLTDQVGTRFGLREIAFDAGQGFLLNGRKLLLNGVCLHHDGGCVGAAVPPQIWKRRLEKFRDMGVNALRFSHNPPDSALLDLADDMGFVVMDEAFDEWHTMKGKQFGSNTHESRGYCEYFDENWREDMSAMILRDRNHPSIIMWSIGNEVCEQVTEDGAQYAKMLAGLCHSLDPTRPITQACDQMKAEPYAVPDAFLRQLDIVGVNYVDRWRERTETFFDEEKLEHPQWLFLGTEDIAVNGKRGDYRIKTEESVWGRTPYYAKMLKAEKLWKYNRTRKFVLGSFMWTGIDYHGECFWPQKGASAGVLDTCGFEKDGYYFYQSIWRKDIAVLYLCPHLNTDQDTDAAVYPLVCYSNCPTVELLVDGKSYGMKAYEFPNQGMTKHWAHFDKPLSPITTNDLHLAWDIPYGAKEITAIGRDLAGSEIMRRTLTRASSPAMLEITPLADRVPADGRAVIEITFALKDANGVTVPDDDRLIALGVEGAELLGMDNGDPDCHILYRAGSRPTYCGLAYALLRAPQAAGEIRVHVEADGLPGQTLILYAE